MVRTLVAIAISASLGGWLRSILGEKLKEFFPSMPAGALVANLAGGYFIGLTIGFWMDSPLLFPRWHIAIITSFCLGLAVFSLASAGSATLSHKERFIPAIGAISLHVIALLAMTALGALTFHWVDDI
ncbi:MAG: CrcB family protein [Pseudomonas sp.]|uniref:Fluoride-specific ion channel n=1 Tax=Pseudomonas zeae TaxID=2745510 RepID=A0A9E6NQT0_9PSED|nr:MULTISPECIES: CrcB family protein [Pseudomonas]MBL7228088.1 CrcB family protein [Pseudomonas sp.]QXI12583.1 CrcB family protein [Pseudomonas zeae]